MAICVLFGGCMKDSVSEADALLAEQALSGINVRAANEESSMPSVYAKAPLIFTGNDILWYSESTKEIRFRDNTAMKDVFSKIQMLAFYLEDEYLFSAVVYFSGAKTQTINNLVFFYNVSENKYYLLTGYPPDVSLVDNNSRDTSMKNIASEWKKFIDQLKKEGKHRA